MTIAEVSAKYGITAETLRYYENIGLLPPVPRNSGGIRDYGEADCRWIEFIKCMRSAGLSIKALSQYVGLCREGEGTARERLDILIEQRALIRRHAEELDECLKRLDYKIKEYYSLILPAEEKLG